MRFHGRGSEFEAGDAGLGAPTAAVQKHLTGAGQGAHSIWLMGVADPVRLHILCTLSEVIDATAADLAAAGAASAQTLRRHLDALVALGVIWERPGESDGETPGRPPARFSLPPEVRKGISAVLNAPG